MNSNLLKSIACISMFIDHVGYFLFPNLIVLRYIGRLAMPIFAFFIAEGCRHTKNAFKYFSGVFFLGLLCQIAVLGYDYFGSGINSILLNVLFTLSLSIPLCSFFLKSGNKNLYSFLFFMYLIAILVFDYILKNYTILGVDVSLDYGLAGIILCFSAVTQKDSRKRMATFSVGVIVYCLLMQSQIPYIWFSLLSIPLLALYNGQRGSKNLKYAFYIFYPAHIALIYGISYLITPKV